MHAFSRLQLLEENVRNRILGPRDKCIRWIQNLKNSTSPHFEEIHEALNSVKTKLEATSVKDKSKL